MATKSKPAAETYTDPALRERLKEEIKAGDKGGKPGQWSARKSQLLSAEYEKAGGGYRSDERTEAQKDLEHWTEEDAKPSDEKRDGKKDKQDPRAKKDDKPKKAEAPKSKDKSVKQEAKGDKKKAPKSISKSVAKADKPDKKKAKASK